MTAPIATAVAESGASADLLAQCHTADDGYHLHKYVTADGLLRIDHDFNSWDPHDAVAIPATIDGYRPTRYLRYLPEAEWVTGVGGFNNVRARHAGNFPTVAAAFAALLPGTAIPHIACHLEHAAH